MLSRLSLRWPASLLALAAVCLGAAGCGSSVVDAPSSAPVSTPPPVAPPAPAGPIWAGAWGAAMTNAQPSSDDNPGGTDQSFRFLVTPTVGGTEERVRFSNVYGTTPVVIGSARLSVGSDGTPAVDPAHDAALSFGGQPGVTVPAGQTVVSDPVMVTYSFGQTLAVSVYLRGSFSPVSRHDSIFITNYKTAPGAGDKTADTAGTSYTETLSDWLMVNEIDVYGKYEGTIALFGSSTTDGYHSNYSSDKVYPVPNAPVPGQHTSRLSDALARRLNAAGHQTGVVNLGVPGDTVTVDSTNANFHVLNANDRFAQDVLPVPSLLSVVTYFGSIDIRSPDCKSAPAIEAATERLVAQAAAAKLPLFLATIPPSAFCTNPAQPNFGPTPNPADPYAGGPPAGGGPPANGGEAQRLQLNAWIRSVGAGLPGVVAIADLDLALADPARPDFLLSPYNSGDNYHPTGAGYTAEAAALPLSLLLQGH